MKLVLASQSPRRSELFSLMGLTFTVIPSEIDESRYPDETPDTYARRMSYEKARAVAAMLTTPAMILAADTIVADGGEIIGKPFDAETAKRSLQQLRGHTHRVLTAVTMLDTSRDRHLTQLAISPVMMRDYTDEEIDIYIGSGDPFDKAGAYAIQHTDFRPAEEFTHCFANVMGLPLCHVLRMLWAFGLTAVENVPVKCQSHIKYDCTVHEAIRSGGE